MRRLEMANSKEEEECRMYFQILMDDIRYSKQQQWNTIYLTLIAIGAILGVFLTVESKGYCFAQPLPILKISLRSFLIGICIFILGLGIAYIWRYYVDIERYRYKSRLILTNRFSDDTETIAEKEPEWFESKWYKFLRREYDFVWFFILFSILILLATILVICIMMKI
jgi:hypothetical protein